MSFKNLNNKINFKFYKNNKISFFFLSRLSCLYDFKNLKKMFILIFINHNYLVKYNCFLSFKLLFFLFNKTNFYQIFNKFKIAKAKTLADLSLSEDKATISYLLNKLFYNFEIKFNQNLFYNFINSLKIFIFLFFYYFFEKSNSKNYIIRKSLKKQKNELIYRSKKKYIRRRLKLKKWKKFGTFKKFRQEKRKQKLFNGNILTNSYFIKNILTIKKIKKKRKKLFLFDKSSYFSKRKYFKSLKKKRKFIKNFKYFLYDTIYFKSLSKNKLDVLNIKKLSKPQRFFIKSKVLLKKKLLKANFPISKFCKFFKKERRFRFINFSSNFAIISLNYTGSNIFINISVVYQKIALTIAFFSGVY